MKSEYPNVFYSRLNEFHIFLQVSVPNNSHLASTYCALAILKTFGYDFSFINSSSILKSMKCLQQSDGSFMPIHTGAETDLRFVYCAGNYTPCFFPILIFFSRMIYFIVSRLIFQLLFLLFWMTRVAWIKRKLKIIY
ncbi:hypothetical protein LXL04_024077 [Taraxacum kok-saghyz]